MFVVNGPIGHVGPTVSNSSSQVPFAPDTVSAREAPADIALPRPIMASDAAGKSSRATSQKDTASEPRQDRNSRIGLFEGINAETVFEAITQPKQDMFQLDTQNVANWYIEAISAQTRPMQTAQDPKITQDVPDAILLDSTNPFERSNNISNPIDLRF